MSPRASQRSMSPPLYTAVHERASAGNGPGHAPGLSWGIAARGGDVMTAKRPTADGTGGKKPRRTSVETTATSTASQPPPERRFVDIDPWAVLLEGLMVTPEEEPAERKGGKGK